MNDVMRDTFEAECLRYWGKDRCSDFDLIDGKYLSARAALAWSFWQAATEQGKRQPPYPEGDVVGPCVCGSWPGGKCLKCPWISTTAQRQPLTEAQIDTALDTINLGWWDVSEGATEAFARAIEAAHGITATPQGGM